jgi:hypothetical protein
LGFDFSENGRRMGWEVIWDGVRENGWKLNDNKWKLNDNKMEVLEC